MARPYPDKFEREISPLSPQSASLQTPISYSSNINRQKTKKWVEAKPADYGGDDWGDDYNDYPTPPAPPMPNITGLRQPGQASQSPISGGFSGDQGNKKAYGDLPSIPTEAQPRSATNPVRDHTNSFTQGDERRAFSGGYAHPSPAPDSISARVVSQVNPIPSTSTTAQSSHPPALQVSTQVPAVTGIRKTVQSSSPVVAQPPQGSARGMPGDEPESGTSSKYSEATSKNSEMRTPSSDYQTRRDFSPSAVSHPLQSRYSPVPQSATGSPSSRFPPRKSSISHPIPPEVFETSQPAQDVNAPKPWTGARSSSPGATARSPTTPSRALPFIRPADIYKRLEEEREKERQSMDSSRPSLESIVGSKARERSASPAKAPLRGQSSSDSLGRGYDRVIYESEDKQDSSRRLAPMLQPVQERKSEYGFEGYDPTLSMKDPEEKANFEGPKESQMGHLGPEEMRRFSTSPKLPDLNRISGFGLDLFSKSDIDETSFQDSVLKSIPESGPSTTQNTSSLRTQPSLGFTSVVQQAFDAGNSSIPDTPASVTSSRIELAGSESTSTTGISPIMSRLPSTGTADTQDRVLDTHETTNLSIAEVDEPDSGEDSAQVVADVPERQATPHHRDVEELVQHPIRPGHRRNISTPSPGNSPARTPNVTTTMTENITVAEEAHISPASDQPVSPMEEELPAPSRPFAKRELSPRPAPPGGWVSYATSASNSTTEPESRDTQRIEVHNLRTDPMDEPVSPISEIEEDGDDVDLTPTTAKQTLPQSVLGAAAGAAFGGVAASTLDRRDIASLNSPSPIEGLEHVPPMIPSNSAIPTPDPALAPAENPYAASEFDPRLQPEPTHNKSSLQVPNVSSPGTTSTTSAEPPTPPPKDTPADGPPRENPEYFPPTVPLKLKTSDEVAADEDLMPPMRPQMLPTLSTQTSPQDEESDKLRKEIIKSLSPNISDTEARQRLAPPILNENNHGTESADLGARESTYLPSEYDNYWESTNEAGAEQREREEMAEEPGLKPEPQEQPLTQKGPAVVQDTRESTPLFPPLNPQRVERTSAEMPPQRPPLHPNRFSWEAGPEEVSSSAVPINTKLQASSSGIDPRYAATPDSQLRQLEKTREAYFEHGPISSSVNTPAPEGTLAGHPRDDTSSTSASNINDQRRSGGQESSDSHIGSEATLAAADVTGAAPNAGRQVTQPGVPQRCLSLAEEKSPANASTYAVSPTPPEDEHPARVSHPVIPSVTSTSRPVANGQPNGREPGPSLRPQQTPDVTKIAQFRDILAFQNPEQRIRAYNDTRNQFAIMDTGLNEWLMFINNQHNSFPASLTTISNDAERPKVAKSSLSSVPGTPLQQPYYQQYLNASPTSSVPSATRPGTGITSGTQQGFSPSSSKLSGQQAQTKSKDLLHSTGVFGGKSNKAGKGFFAKGKNKFRGSGGGDKNSPPLEASPPPKPKVNEGRTSSWNMSLSSLTLPRSSARADTQSQQSRDSTPPPRQSQLGPETPTVTPLRQSQLGPETRHEGNAGQTELFLWDAPVSAVSTPSIPHASPQPSTNNDNHSSRYISSNNPVSKEEEEGHDTLGVPPPIGKHQPSWDPYNATPIVEEEGFQYNERPLKQTPAIQTAVNRQGAPQIPIDSRNTSEEPNEDDWVIISKENVPKTSELTYRPPIPAQEYVRTGAHVYQPAPFPPFAQRQSIAQQSPVAQQSQATYQAAANRPAGFQYSRTNQPPTGSQPPAGYQPPAAQQPSAASQPAAASQASPASKGGFRGRFIQHIRQRSSTDSSANVPAAGQTSPPRAATKVEQPDPIVENKDAERRPTEFVGLPPIRRSSTFGLGFRTKDSSKRFPLDDDDDDDDEPQVPSIPLTSEAEVNSQRQDVMPLAPKSSQGDANSQSGNRLAGGHVPLGATANAAAVGDSMNQPSDQPSRYSNQDEKSKHAATEIPERPPLPNVSSEYGRPSNSSPVSPPVSSPVSPPGSRTLTATPQREPVGGPTGQQADPHQVYVNKDRRSDAEWRPNARLPQEQRAAPSTTFQYPPPFEGQQVSSDIIPTAVHPRHPSFEGQRPAIPLSHARGPSLEGQRIHPPSSSSQGNAGNLPVLGNGVFVPPPRAGPNQQKPFDQPPSSAQRYPALFRTEHGNDASVDGLPAHYYQAPISKEDAFLPRQQTNEYQLPGVGPPPDEPQSGKRNSRRNSALLKELGGRLSRSTSRDRGSILDDVRSPTRPVDSRDSNDKEFSAASITSEDTVEQKKRRSGLGFFGALRRDTTGGPAQSRESMVTHLPGSRTDLLQPQQPSSPLPLPNKKKLFFNSSRNSPDVDNSQQNILSRTSTSSLVAEQPGKKKRFSGLTNMFSRPSPEQEGKDPRGSAVQAAQDPRNYQHPTPHSQVPQYLEHPNRMTKQDPRNFNEGAKPPGQGAPPSQAGPQISQGHSLRGPIVAGYVPQSQLQPAQAAQIPQGVTRQDPAFGRQRQMSQPLPLTGLQNPTLQQSLIEGPLAQPRRFSEQSVPKSHSLQNHQQRTAAMTPSGPLLQPLSNLQIPQNHQQQTPSVTQTSPLSQNFPNSQSPQNIHQQTSMNHAGPPYHAPAPLKSPGQTADNKVNSQQGPPQGSGVLLNLPPLQVPQQPQYQQRLSADSRQVNSRSMASPQAAPLTSQERQQVLSKQSPIQANQPRAENKQRQGSTARLLGGLIGGRRSSGQGKDTAETQLGAAPQMALPPGGQQQRQQYQQQQRLPQQQMSTNNQFYGAPGQGQPRGHPMTNERQYEPLPIPGAYGLVRGEGGQLAPTLYDPRGLNGPQGPYNKQLYNQQYMHQDPAHSYQSRPPQNQVQPYHNDQYTSINRPNVPQIITSAPQNPIRDIRPSAGPVQNSQNPQNPTKASRPLSREDIVARSPARPQFGQQAPYQLSLPDENPDDDEQDRPLRNDKNVPSERQLPLGGKPHGDNKSERTLPPITSINTAPQLLNPILRHPLSPATYPLPEDSLFSPINPEADQIPPPPPPKWPQLAAPSLNLDRSNTINTHGSEVSQLSGQLNVPGPPRPKEQERPASVTPPSPQITPERSPEQVSRHVVSTPAEEDVYSASPRNSVTPQGNDPAASEKTQQSPEKIPVDEGRRSQSRRRRTSQEEKILVEEGMRRPGSAEEEIPSMSATSYPGQEWHPYGNGGYEDWD